MEKISKKLKNVLTIKGKKEKLNEFIERLKKNGNVIEVKLPEYDIRKIDSNFIDNNWNKSESLENVIFCGMKGKTLVVAFSNENFESVVIDILEQLELNAKYKYLIEDIANGVIVNEKFILGKVDFDSERESRMFKLNDYSVARCF